MGASGRNRPRWFVPALYLGSATLAAILVFGTYLDPTEVGPIRVGERYYLVPPAEISSVRSDPPLFIRISPPNKPFHIVRDEKSVHGRDSSGVPHIFSINDGAGHHVVYRRHGRSIVVCRRASNPAGGCGTWIDFGGGRWSVLFPESRAADADKFVREARNALRRYDSGSCG
jgi:hypothetical protein